MVVRTAYSPDRADLDAESSIAVSLGSGTRASAFRPDAVSDSLEGYRLAVAGLDHPVHLGTVGDMAHTVGGWTALVADSDERAPSAYGLAMDSTGHVDSPRGMSAESVRDPAYPFGIRPDVDSMTRDCSVLLDRSSLVVCETSALARASAYESLALPQASQTMRVRTLTDVDRLIRSIAVMAVQSAGYLRQLYVVIPLHDSDVTPPRLALFVECNSGSQSGLLSSPSTRHAGLSVITDFAPTLAEFWRIAPPRYLVGRAVTTQDSPAGTLQPMLTRYRDLMLRARQQNALGGLPTVQAALITLALMALIKLRRPGLSTALAAGSVAMPLGMLVLPLAHPASVVQAALLLACLFSACLLVSAGLRQRRVEFLIGLLLLTLAVIAIDLLRGGLLLSNAWMSYSVVEGARFYGIGNEYMGVVIGIGIALIAHVCKNREGAASSIHRRNAIIAGAICVALVGVMAAPSMGAKVGAVPSAVIAWGAALLASSGRKLKVREVIILVALAALALAALALMDLHRAGSDQSHLARALTGGGGDTPLGIAWRKLSLEARLLVSSPWALLAAVAGGSVIVLTRKGLLPQGRPVLLAGSVAGTVACIAFNDSGISAAGMLLLYVSCYTMTAAAEQGRLPTVPNE
jgi:hypothetical protein